MDANNGTLLVGKIAVAQIEYLLLKLKGSMQSRMGSNEGRAASVSSANFPPFINRNSAFFRTSLKLVDQFIYTVSSSAID